MNSKYWYCHDYEDKLYGVKEKKMCRFLLNLKASKNKLIQAFVKHLETTAHTTALLAHNT